MRHVDHSTKNINTALFRQTKNLQRFTHQTRIGRASLDIQLISLLSLYDTHLDRMDNKLIAGRKTIGFTSRCMAMWRGMIYTRKGESNANHNSPWTNPWGIRMEKEGVEK